MTHLDQHRYSEPVASLPCSECGAETDCLAFWEGVDTDCPADVALCLPCLFDAENQFKNKTPAQVIRAYETIKDIEERDDVIVVTARSQLGTVHYVHHAETTFNVVDESMKQNKKKIHLKKGRELTGTAEAFTGSGEFLAPISTYSGIAADHLSV